MIHPVALGIRFYMKLLHSRIDTAFRDTTRCSTAPACRADKAFDLGGELRDAPRTDKRGAFGETAAFLGF